MTFAVCLTKFMNPKGHMVISGQLDQLYESKSQFDLWLWPWIEGQAFDLAGDHKYLGNTTVR